MTDTSKLLDELVDAGHSLKWARKKVELVETDNMIEDTNKRISKLMDSGKPFSLISAELDRLHEEVNQLQDAREEMLLQLHKIED